MRTVGITGPSGSGKSLLCEYIKNTGVPCIDADALYHSMLTPHAPILQAIADAFGAEVLNPDGSLNRQVLGACVFGDKEKLELGIGAHDAWIKFGHRDAGHISVKIDYDPWRYVNFEELIFMFLPFFKIASFILDISIISIPQSIKNPSIIQKSN